MINKTSDLCTNDEYLKFVENTFKQNLCQFFNNFKIVETLIKPLSDFHKIEMLTTVNQRAILEEDERIIDRLIYFNLKDDIKNVLLLVPEKERPNLIKKNSKGRNPLQLAIKRGHWDIVNVIFQSLPDEFQVQIAEINDNEGKNLLHYIAEYSKDESNHHTMQAVLKKCINLINSFDANNKTPLHYAAENSSLILLKFYAEILLPEGLLNELNKLDKKNRSALDYAILGGSIEFNKHLISYTPSFLEQLNQSAEKLSKELFYECWWIKKNIKVILPINSKILFKFKVKVIDHHLCLFTKDKESVIKYVNLIMEYSLRMSSQIKTKEYSIEKVTKDEDLKKGFKYLVNIEKILPFKVCSFFGSRHGNVGRNCHGTAAVVAGIADQLSAPESPFKIVGFDKHFTETSIDEISNGDWIYLKGAPLKGGTSDFNAHSFIFLSDELCLSMNGGQKKLKFYPTEFVLNIYGYPKESLENGESTWQNNLSIFKKLPVSL